VKVRSRNSTPWWTLGTSWSLATKLKREKEENDTIKQRERKIEI